MQKKQSSVEIAIEKLSALIPEGNDFEIGLIAEQVKEVHKEEVIDGILDNRNITSQVTFKDAEKYYNETFGGNND